MEDNMKVQQTKKQVSWDDIPSLEGLGVDWEYNPSARLDKRAFVRMDMEGVSQLVEVRTIEVRLATVNKNHVGTLVDVSAGGIAMTLPVQLEIDQPVKVGFFLGRTKIISRGLVRHAQKKGELFQAGIQFVDLASDLVEYISGLYAAKVLYHST